MDRIANTSKVALGLALQKAGSASALARFLGISPSAVLQWDEVPPSRVLAVEKMTGVSRYDLRPDIYGSAPKEEIA